MKIGENVREEEEIEIEIDRERGRGGERVTDKGRVCERKRERMEEGEGETQSEIG